MYLLSCFITLVLATNVILITTFPISQVRFPGRFSFKQHTSQILTLDDCIDLLQSIDSYTKVDVPTEFSYAKKPFPTKNSSNVEYSCDFYRGSILTDYLRIVRFVGERYKILNVLVLPKVSAHPLPMLGIDLVVLPGNSPRPTS